MSLITEDGLAEPFIGQHLVKLSHGFDAPVLHYWQREGNAEGHAAMTAERL